MKPKKKIEVDKSVIKDCQIILVKLTQLQKRVLGETNYENDSSFSIVVGDVYGLFNKLRWSKTKGVYNGR